MAMDVNVIIELVLKVVALAMGIVSVVLTFFQKETNRKLILHCSVLG
jgi:hypothetical protein